MKFDSAAVQALADKTGEHFHLLASENDHLRVGENAHHVSDHCPSCQNGLFVAGNDIRSCLSTLQFLHSKKGAVSMTDVTAVNVGNKDSQQTLGNVLHGIFTKPREAQSRLVILMRQLDGFFLRQI